MKYKLISCEVFTREVCYSAYKCENTIDFYFTPKAAHEKPELLKGLIQEIIDKTEETDEYDAILLGFGLCGNSVLGLKSTKIPLVIPRAHDCCTIFLGSKKKFLDNFQDNLSREWTSSGYMERGDSYLRESDTGVLLGLDRSYLDFVEKYGEENAEYLWETLHPKPLDNTTVFINIPETTRESSIKAIENHTKENNNLLKIINGDICIINNLLGGNWKEDEFLIIPPNNEIKSAFDMDIILKY